MAQLDEAKALNSDLLEIYADWGTNSIVLKRLDKDNSLVDDVYGDITEIHKIYSCIGRIKPTPIDEIITGIGMSEDEAQYTIYVVIEPLIEQGVTEINREDSLEYLGNNLEILSVVPSALIGDYALQWKIIAKGKVANALEIK